MARDRPHFPGKIMGYMVGTLWRLRLMQCPLDTEQADAVAMPSVVRGRTNQAGSIVGALGP